jgi:DNA-binding CsgD family transcriptional regulator
LFTPLAASDARYSDTGRREKVAGRFDVEAAAQLEAILAAFRAALAALVVVMAFLFSSASRLGALAAAGVALAYSIWISVAGRRRIAAGTASALSRASLGLDAILALAVYGLFARSPRAMPVAFVLLVVFELCARFGARGLIASVCAMGAALAGRIYLQLAVLPDGAFRPDVLSLWLTVALLMVCFAHEFRVRQREQLAVLRERARICEAFQDTVERVLGHFGVRPGSKTLTEIHAVFAPMLEHKPVDHEALARHLANLITAARDELGLTRREQEIASMLARRLSDAQISRELYLSQSTVRNHIHHIKAKLGVESRAELIRLLQGERIAETG